MSREEMAEWITKATHHHVSETLIGILEGGGVTHPKIAARIINAMGASGERFDRIVNKEHRGRFTRNEKLTKSAGMLLRRMFDKKREPQVETEAFVPMGTDILLIDKSGSIIAEYRSAIEAENAGHARRETIRDHARYKCNDNFHRYGCVFRRRSDFTPEEKQRIIETAIRQMTPIKNLRAANANSIIEHNGQQKPLKVWADEAGMDFDTVKKRLQRGVPFERAFYNWRKI